MFVCYRLFRHAPNDVQKFEFRAGLAGTRDEGSWPFKFCASRVVKRCWSVAYASKNLLFAESPLHVLCEKHKLQPG